MDKEIFFVIGVMSGTSLDGLDMAFCKFIRENKQWSYQILKTSYYNYTIKQINLLKEAYTCSGRRLKEIDKEFGRFIGLKVKSFAEQLEMPVMLVSSHGHTVFHEPQKGYTLQIGSGAQIAAVSGITTVCDFRDLDVSLGGQGAPLVPVGDDLLFGDFAACLNLGGFANISFKDKSKRVAFDICPVNFVLNILSQKAGQRFDNEGTIASSGKVIPELMDNLNKLDYYELLPPKTLGQEWVEDKVYSILQLYQNASIEDLLATFTGHFVIQIAHVLEKISGDKVLLTGGGSYNKYLVDSIKEITEKTIVLPSKELIDFKEAVVFAFLGVLRSQNEINTLASVTGAKSDSSGGIIYLHRNNK